MEESMEDDCIYDDLPEMCDTTTLNDENPAPSSSSEGPSKNCVFTKNKIKTSVKECVCRGNVEWTWDNDNKSDNVEILNDNMDVRFNKNYSNGTAVVRCTEPMTNNQYYWEVKMTYPVYGTDIMIGVGTPEARIRHFQHRYCSRLGMDKQTWGFSYTGLFHHNGERRCYAQKFDQGSTVGVHVDLWKGTLSFYKDRKPLGVASSGLKGKTLYAMASSTAACSGMRMIRSCSFPSCLQFLCATKLRELIPDDKNVLDVINFPPGLKQFLQTNLSWLLEKRQLEEDFKTCCVLDESLSDNEGIADESYTYINNRRVYDVNSREGQFILVGPFIFREFVPRRRAIRCIEWRDREDSPERDTKRRCTSYHYAYGLSDHDSD